MATVFQVASRVPAPLGIAGAGDQLLHIDGTGVAALDGATFDVFDPATGERIGTAAAGSGADIDRAVASARHVFDRGTWRDKSGADRQRILWRAADAMEAEAEALARLEAWNAGMLFPIAQGAVMGAIEMLRYYAGWATKIHGISADLGGHAGRLHAYTAREPVGVVGMIVPWNFPISLAMIKLAPALAAGCSCVVKPAEETPFTALALARLFEAAGVPPGVVNVVTGLGHVAGAAIAEHPDIDKVAFTGSTEVGKKIVVAAAGNLKKLTLELGGKSPVILCDDADLDSALPAIAGGIFLHSGQVCIAGSRLYAHRSIADQVIERLAGIARGLRVGSSFDPESQLGPVISARQSGRIARILGDAAAAGAQIVTGGGHSDEAGYYVEPTVVAHPARDAALVRNEIFGPVLTVNAFDDEEEVLAAANDSAFGLASAVWTSDLARGHRIARGLRAGFAWINCAFVSDPSMPGGGFKQSGWGREMGEEGLAAYLETKSVFAPIG